MKPNQKFISFLSVPFYSSFSHTVHNHTTTSHQTETHKQQTCITTYTEQHKDIKRHSAQTMRRSTPDRHGERECREHIDIEWQCGNQFIDRIPRCTSDSITDD